MLGAPMWIVSRSSPAPLTSLLLGLLVAGQVCAAGCREPLEPPRGGPAPAAPYISGEAAEDHGAGRVDVWECADGVRLLTLRGADTLVAELSGASFTLSAEPAASGARYGDGEATLWMKASELRLEVGRRQPVRCVRDARGSALEASRLAGFDFWATGNEPGWTLELGDAGILWTTGYGASVHHAELPAPDVEASRRRTTYRAATSGADLVVTLEAEECRDDMSGERFPTRVIVEWDTRTYRGCGLSLG